MTSPLEEALKRKKAAAEPASKASKPKRASRQSHTPVKYVAPSRIGKKKISGDFDPEVSKQLRAIALEQDRSLQSVLTEALNDFFVKYGNSGIA